MGQPPFISSIVHSITANRLLITVSPGRKARVMSFGMVATWMTYTCRISTAVMPPKPTAVRWAWKSGSTNWAALPLNEVVRTNIPLYEAHAVPGNRFVQGLYALTGCPGNGAVAYVHPPSPSSRITKTLYDPQAAETLIWLRCLLKVSKGDKDSG